MRSTQTRTRAALAALALGGALAAGLTLGTGQAAANPQPYTGPYCTPHLVLALDGTKGPVTPTSIDPRSPLNGVTDTYRAAPGTLVEHIAYPGGMIADVYGWTMSYDESVEAGKNALRSRIAWQEQNCGPTTTYTLIGYSQGARIVGDVAVEMDSDRITDDGTDLQDRVHVHLYSDPRQPGTGIEVVLAGADIVDGVTFAGERPEIVNISVQWHCLPGDGVCDANDPVDSDTIVGYLLNHTRY